MRARPLPAEAWIDELDDHLLHSGEFDALIRGGRVKGLTSNPSILEAAFARSIDGPALARRYRCSSRDIYEELAYEWIVSAADSLRGVHQESGGHSGYVSIELPPTFARNRHDTVRESQALARRLDRPNVMIKIPGTPQGLAATSELLAAGIPVNVTLLFDPVRFDAVAAAYLDGISRLPGKPAGHHPACVASFFVSRIDTAIDGMLRALANSPAPQAADAASLIGVSALACAETTWARYQTFTREHRPPGDGPGLRVLWASTSAKDPAFEPLKYVRSLMRPGTVTTMSRSTLDTWLNETGRPPAPAEAAAMEGSELRARLAALDIDLDAVIATLEAQGLKQFEDAFDRMMRALGASGAVA